MLTEPRERRTPLRDLAVPLTAQAAFREAWPAATQYDPDARLVLITSGEDLDGAGQAGLWEFFVDLPGRQAQGTFSVGRVEVPEDDDLEYSPILLEQVRPFVPPGDLWEVLRQGEAATRRYYTAQWLKHLAGRPALPVPFYDSSRAVPALAAQGVEFGRRGQYLGARVQVTGEAVWYIQVGEDVVVTAFAPLALPPG